MRRKAGIEKIIAASQPGEPRSSRVRAIEALGRIGRGRPDATAALLAQLSDPHQWTRRRVINAVSRVGGDDARRSLVEQRQREHRKDMRKAVDDALARLDSPETLDQLLQPLEDFPNGAYAVDGDDGAALPLDPWGNAYLYALEPNPARGGRIMPKLWSKGPNGIDDAGSGDDIVKF